MLRRRGAVAAVALTGFCVAVTGSSAQPSHLILFATASWTHSLPPDLWTMRADGSGLRRLHVPAAELSLPMWSPNGRRVVFAFSQRHGEYPDKVAVVNTEHRASRLTSLGSQPEGSPTWSPDGRWIAFVGRETTLRTADSGHLQAVYVIHPDGTGRRRVTPPKAYYSEGAWSPDSRKIVVAYSNADDGDCFGSRFLLVTLGRSSRDLDKCGFSPTWTHDGRSIIYSNDDFADPGVKIFRAEGGPDRRLTSHLDMGPTLSPDGRHLVFIRQAEDATNARWLVTLDLRTGAERMISPRWDDFVSHTLSWSPDGTIILFDRRFDEVPPGVCTVWRINSTGAALKQIFKGTTCAEDWKPGRTS